MKPSQVAAAINACANINRPLFIWGPPGVGKSDSVRRAARADKRHAYLFLDEMNSAQPATQAALYQLVLDRRVGDYKLPDGWRIIAAGNRSNDRGVVHRIPDPLADRFFHVDYDVDMQDWCNWAINGAGGDNSTPDNVIDFRAALRDAVDIMGLPGSRVGADGVGQTFYNMPAGLPRTAYGEPEEARPAKPIRPEVVAFIRFRQGLLHAHDTKRECHAITSPRGWADVSLLLDDAGPLPDGLESDLIRGRVGDGAASEFVAFLHLYRGMVTPDQVLANPKGVKVPESVSTLYAIGEALARRATVENLSRVLTFAKRMPVEYSQCLVSSAVKITPELTGTREYIDWCVAQQK